MCNVTFHDGYEDKLNLDVDYWNGVVLPGGS